MLVAVCRLVQQKGVDVAIDALVRVRERHPAAHLVVLGEGPLRAELERPRSRARGSPTRSASRDASGTLPGGFAVRTLVVHPARWEGFGLALLEAMLCERAVVASRVSSIPEIVARRGDRPARAAGRLGSARGCVVALLDDPARARALGAAGGERAREDFSVARMAERTAAVYDEALSSSRR